MIQRCIRGWLARCQYRSMVRGVTLLQAEVRRRIALQHWKELKVVTVTVIMTAVIKMIMKLFPVEHKPCTLPSVLPIKVKGQGQVRPLLQLTDPTNVKQHQSLISSF